MKAGLQKLTSQDKRARVRAIVDQCHAIARAHIDSWQPVDPKWETIEGCAYLRLSTDEQVAVEKGSLEQQVYIAIAEANTRSSQDRVNYKIIHFYIEPGITGRHDNRPEFNAMEAEIDDGRYGFVVFKELARIAREVSIWKRFFNRCIGKGCQIFIRSFPFNPNDPAQIFQLDILAAFAEYESNQTSRRVRESTFSAMLSAGKFNSTKPILGLDGVVVGGERKVGLYQANPDELKKVEWIMQTFVKYGAVQRTLDECHRLGIQNKDGQDFTRATLMTVLTNQRYIGQWELNVENKSKSQQKLMPFDRYALVDLPHGCVIDRALWDSVQATLLRISGTKDKNSWITRVFPLSGLLKYGDGTPFHGTGATGRLGRVNYYFNKQHTKRIPAESVEDEVKRLVCAIIKDSREFQDAIVRHGEAEDTGRKMLDAEAQRLRDVLAEQERMKGSLNRRLDYLLGGDATPEQVQLFKLPRTACGRAPFRT